jgi:hypothetical protein
MHFYHVELYFIHYGPNVSSLGWAWVRIQASALASALCLVKTQTQEPNILLLIKSNSQDKGHPDGHTAIGA